MFSYLLFYVVSYLRNFRQDTSQTVQITARFIHVAIL